MANMGTLALILALGLAICGTISALLAAYHARERFRLTAIRAFLGSGLLVLVAIICLGFLLQRDEFSIVYVQRHSNAALPAIFKLTAIWGGSQGSLLWWTLILCAYTAVFLALTRKAPRLMTSWAMVFIGLSLIFFLVINNMVANPFYTWNQILPNGEAPIFNPRDGNGLNPQLQHWAMIIHPPLLYTGYIGFLFPFAMALGALITRMEGREWIRIIRNWTLVAWLVLGVGIVLGGAWAYMELGWGGYWAWDPVENASFMPWLLATAFIHSVMAQEKRGIFKLWNILLLVATFLMCMFGTFITRSGLISSVHAFAESDIGFYFIGYIILNAILSAWVLISRRGHLKDDNAFYSFASKEVSLLFNNVLFITISFTMLLATVFPMLTEALSGEKRELRHGFYNTVEIPIFLGLLLLMAIGPIVTWKRTSNRLLRERFLWPAVILVLVSGIGLLLFPHKLMAMLSFGVLSFLLLTILQEFWIAITRRSERSGENPLGAFLSIVSLNKRRYGGYIAHFAVLLMAIGITGAAFNQQAKEELGVGEIMRVGGYTFQVESIRTENTDNYASLVAQINLIENGRVAKKFFPEQRLYHASQSQASEVDISTSPARDFYVVLAGPGTESTTEHPIGVFHIYVNPLVLWIWIGTLLLVLGTAISMVPDRLRQNVAAEAPIGMEEPA